MSEVLFSQIIFFLAVGWLFFFPGYLIVSATVGHALTPLEKIVLSPVFGLVFVNFAVLAAGASGVSIDRDLALFIPSLALLFPLSTRLFRSFDRQEKKEDFPSSLLLETRAAILAGLIIASALLTKTVFLGNTIFPTATDLGHHLFWVQKIISEEKLPVYQKQKISTNGEEISLGQPEPIADFIIGEHIPFALLARLTGGDLFGPEPVLFLSLLNIFSFLALYVLARRLFAHLPYARAAALLVLALGAALWAVSGPQSKFVSGGVIGNVMGNLFIPSVWLLLFLALRNFSGAFLALAAAAAAGTAYIHHLSVFVLAYLVGGAVLLWLATGALREREKLFRARFFGKTLSAYAKMIFSPAVLSVIAAVLLILFFARWPQYLTPSDIASATGAPSKATRVGLSWAQFLQTASPARLAPAIWGAVLALFWLFFADRRDRRLAGLFIAAPVLTTALMTLWPQAVGVNIISSRVANYALAPLTLAAGLGLGAALWSLRTGFRSVPALVGATTLLLWVWTVGTADNAHSLRSRPDVSAATQTFAAAAYLAPIARGDGATVLKDHNYLTADTWMKLFFLGDYSQPLSRSYFSRYDRNPSRERCTLEMIGSPFSTKAQKCFTSLNVRYLVVNPKRDWAQFRSENDPTFAPIYLSDDVAVFYRR